MKFINLTSESGLGIIINLSHVIKIRKQSKSKGSLIISVGNDITNVKETLAEITVLIRDN
jgi:hypothetical protein